MNAHQLDIIKLCLLVVLTLMVGVFVFGKSNSGSQALVTSTTTQVATPETWCPNVCGASAMRQIQTLCPEECGFGLTTNGTFRKLGAYGTPCALVDPRTYKALYGTSDGTRCRVPTMTTGVPTQ